MAVTQYIGARYVPLFATPLEWDKNRTYEPLTIVIYAGNSYTSRQFVPKNIEIDDDTFWALTGNYNAQVEQYRQDSQRAQEKADAATVTANSAIETANQAKETAESANRTSQNSNSTAQNALDTANQANQTAQTANGTAQAANSTAQAAQSTAQAAQSTAQSAESKAQAAQTEVAKKAPIKHDTSATTYGVGSASNYGHVKLTDTATQTAPTTVTNGVATTPKYVSNLLNAKTHIVCIGDSFTSEKVRTYSWPSQLPTRYTVHNYASGGAGFITTGSQSGTGETNHTFPQQVADAKADTSYNHALVKAVIIYGLYNDYVTHKDKMEECRTAIGKTCEDAANAFPGANIICVIGNNGFGNRSNAAGYRDFVQNMFRATAESNKYRAVNGMYWLYGFGASTVFNTDKLHPNQAGAAIIARYMSALIDGCFEPSSMWFMTSVHTASTEQDTLYAMFNPNGDFKMSGHYTFTITKAGDNSIDLTSVGDGRFIQYYSQTCIPLNVFGNGTHILGSYFNPSNGKFHVMVNDANASGSVYY